MKTLLNAIKLTYAYIGYDTDSNMAKMNTYTCKLTYNKKSMTFNSILSANIITLNENDVTVDNCLYSLLLDADCSNCTFTDFCSEYGYDADSITANRIYHECIKTSKQLNRLFNADELNQLRLHTENM